jgi:hypothetical protein
MWIRIHNTGRSFTLTFRCSGKGLPFSTLTARLQYSEQGSSSLSYGYRYNKPDTGTINRIQDSHMNADPGGSGSGSTQHWYLPTQLSGEDDASSSWLGWARNQRVAAAASRSERTCAQVAARKERPETRTAVLSGEGAASSRHQPILSQGTRPHVNN